MLLQGFLWSSNVISPLKCRNIVTPKFISYIRVAYQLTEAQY